MKDFEYYLTIREVKKCSPDKELALSLVRDMEERAEDVGKIDLERFPKIVFENIYDAFRDFCDALLTIEGYKSYSHEGSISFLSKKGFDIAFMSTLDNFRYKRNGSKYYGLKITLDDAKAIFDFYNSNKSKMNEILRKIGLCN